MNDASVALCWLLFSPAGPVPEVSGGSDSSPEDQIMACKPIEGQAGQLHGRCRLPTPHIPSPWQQQLHDGAEDVEGQQQHCEEGDDGVLRNFP